LDNGKNADRSGKWIKYWVITIPSSMPSKATSGEKLLWNGHGLIQGNTFSQVSKAQSVTQ
jgi:hypothetical protein